VGFLHCDVTVLICCLFLALSFLYLIVRTLISEKCQWWSPKFLLTFVATYATLYGLGAVPLSPYSFTSPPFTLSCSISYFSLFCFLTWFICFLAFPSLPILPESSHSVSRPWFWNILSYIVQWTVMHDQCEARRTVTFPTKTHCQCSFPIPQRVGGWVGLNDWFSTSVSVNWCLNLFAVQYLKMRKK